MAQDGSTSYGGLGPVLVYVSISQLVLATIFVLLRIYTIVFVAPRKAWDLLWTMIAYTLAVLSVIFLSISCRHGLGNHEEDVLPGDLPIANLFSWMTDTCFILSSGFGKLSIIALLFHVQGPTKKQGRRLLWIIGSTDMFWSVFQAIFLWFQCTPIRKLWDQEIAGSCSLSVPILYVGIFVGAWCAACDFILALYPVFLFWRLETSWKKKAGLCGLFLGGAVAGIAAVLKTYYLTDLVSPTDAIYAVYNPAAWATAEEFMIIAMSSVPATYPLFARITRKARTHLSGSLKSRSQVRSTELTSIRGSKQPLNTTKSFITHRDPDSESMRNILCPDSVDSKSNDIRVTTEVITDFRSGDEEGTEGSKESV